jgi:SAM-dependent methyltransferase
VHKTVLDTVKKWTREFGLNDPTWEVLELGSKDFNGSVRPLFNNVKEYIGVDMQDGPGVDLVCDVHSLLNLKEMYPIQDDCQFEDLCFDENQGWCDCHDNRQFDLIICLEMLEHDVAFWRTMNNIGWFLKPRGRLILSARGATRGRDGKNGESMWEHGYPQDYWRFMPQAVAELHKLAGCELLHHIEDSQHPGFISYGFKS